MATRAIYDTAELLLDEPLPETAYESDERPDDLPETAEGEELTYRRLVTEGSYTLANFLARSGSAHNMGIALDLTLEVPGQGDLEMQTEMHDLSWYSVIARNNANAQLLAGYMKGAGFGGPHQRVVAFPGQRDARRPGPGTSISIPASSPEGWAADDNGWRYRRADGSFITTPRRRSAAGSIPSTAPATPRSGGGGRPPDRARARRNGVRGISKQKISPRRPRPGGGKEA